MLLHIMFVTQSKHAYLVRARCFDIRQRFIVDGLALPASLNRQEIVQTLPLMVRSAAHVSCTNELAESACTLECASIEHRTTGKHHCSQVHGRNMTCCRSYLLLLLLPVLHSPLLLLLWLLLLPLPLLLLLTRGPPTSLSVVGMPGASG